MCQLQFCAAIWMSVILASISYGAPTTGQAGDHGSQWQGTTAAVATDPSSVATQAAGRWLMLNTGGSGAGFGKGDLRADLLDVVFWKDGQHGAACGQTGVFYSEDGGLTWRRIRRDPRKEYPDEKGVIDYQVEMSGPEEIWVVEGKHPAQGRHLWHSTNGGKTWEDAAKGFPGPFKSVWGLMVRGKHVWLLGGWAPNDSYRSDDGGKNWSRLKLPKGFEPYKAATPISEPMDELKTVYLLGAVREGKNRMAGLYRSDDAGVNWREIALPDADKLPWLFSQATIAFATPDAGMIGLTAQGYRFVSNGMRKSDPGATAGVLVTGDGGAHWSRQALPDNELLITSLWMDPSNPSHGFAGVWNGYVKQMGGPRKGPSLYETFDGGRHWVVGVRGGSQLNAIFGLDSHRIWAVGDVPGSASNDVVMIFEGAKKQD